MNFSASVGDVKCRRISDAAAAEASSTNRQPERMDHRSAWLLLVSLVGVLLVAGGVELTFELADNAKECFYQEIEKNVSSTLEFQVFARGRVTCFEVGTAVGSAAG